MYNDITGIILSGGKSKRMGVNKSLLKIGDKTIIEIVHSIMNDLFSDILLISNEPELYKFLNAKTFEDIFSGKGPLAGIHSGLLHSKTRKNFIISCDMPLINKEIIESIIKHKKDSPITVAKADGFVQQLCGLYDKDCLKTAEKILNESLNEENRNSKQEKRGCMVLELTKRMGAEIIEAISLPGYKENLFFNMNNLDDYTFVKKKLLNTNER
jgi:molybdopterin-guanine dinucleotide biosynthesis protein A